MNKYMILAAAVLMTGCASFDAQPDDDAFMQPYAAASQAPQCRMGTVRVCTVALGSADQSSCECAYVPASMTGRDIFTPRNIHRRH